MPLSVVITDYDMHALWAVPGVAQYFVATEKIRWKLMHHHQVPAASITVTGIPVDPHFLTPVDLPALRQAHHIAPEERVLLLLSGGQGMVKIDAVLAIIFQHPRRLRIITVTGRNKALEKKIRALTPPSHISLDVLGWTDKMHEYIGLADIVITKPGGSTTAECLAVGKPIIAIQPIPGQEEQNTQYIMEQGYGVVARTAEDLLYYLTQPTAALAHRTLPSEKPPSAAHLILEAIM